MGVIKGVFGWLGRQGLLYVLLVVAIFAGAWVWPGLVQLALGTSPLQERTRTLDAVLKKVGAERAAAQESFRSQAGRLRSESIGALDRRAVDLARQAAALRGELAAAPSPLVLAFEGPDAVLAVERKRLRLAGIEQQLAAIQAARKLAVKNGQAVGLLRTEAAQRAYVLRLRPACLAAHRRVLDFEALPLPERLWRRADERALRAAQATACGPYNAAIERSLRINAAAAKARMTIAAANTAFERAARATDRLIAANGPLVEAAGQAKRAWTHSLQAKLQIWSERAHLPAILRQAAVALALIVAGPFLIRLLCFFVLAPLAMRRPAIRLRTPGGAGAAIPPAARSTTSVAVRLEHGEELLVRQDYLQTTSHTGAKGTQPFLDWRHPITSLATGLWFLTRIRGEGETTTVSAVRDPFAEVTIVTLPEGAACVLHPRALAAVVQPIGRRLRVRTHWRLASLNAWLTLQLRFVVFHGPARLVVKGGRGVRVERAERGRVFGQDQLVGFSADLGYAVTRTETFWPYFLGRESLLKDRVEAGTGVLIVEEAPLTARGGEPRRGIEGLVDVGMKALGL